MLGGPAPSARKKRPLQEPAFSVCQKTPDLWHRLNPGGHEPARRQPAIWRQNLLTMPAAADNVCRAAARFSGRTPEFTTGPPLHLFMVKSWR